MKKYRLTLPCVFPEIDGPHAPVREAGTVVELDEATARAYAHALVEEGE